MKKILIVFVLFLAIYAQAQAQEEKIEVELSQPGKPYSVELSLVHGSIKVVKHSGKDLLVEVLKATSTKTNTVTTKDGMRKISSGRSFEINVEENANKVKIDQGVPLSTVNIVLHAPANGTFRLSTVNNGSISVEDVNGEFELSNVNGKIILKNVSGTAVASTVNGTIQASFDAVNMSKPMAFSTLNGNIDISFPSNIKASIKARTDRGDVYSDFEVGTLKSSSNVVKKAENGYKKIEASEWITGTLNGGGSEIMIKTFNGSIYLRKKS